MLWPHGDVATSGYLPFITSSGERAQFSSYFGPKVNILVNNGIIVTLASSKFQIVKLFH